MVEHDLRAMDPILVVFAAHGRVLPQVVEFIGHFNGLRQADRLLRHRGTARTRRRLVHLDVATAVLRHITSASIAELRECFRRELGGHDVAPPRDDTAGHEVLEVVADACDVEGGALGAISGGSNQTCLDQYAGFCVTCSTDSEVGFPLPGAYFGGECGGEAEGARRVPSSRLGRYELHHGDTGVSDAATQTPLGNLVDGCAVPGAAEAVPIAAATSGSRCLNLPCARSPRPATADLGDDACRMSYTQHFDLRTCTENALRASLARNCMVAELPSG